MNGKTRKATPSDYPAILTIWMQSVSATHHFLSPEDFDAIYVGLKEAWLDAVPEIRVWEEEGEIMGFIGLDLPRVEMLFISPEKMGKGIGTRLLDSAKNDCLALSVDVNEQNPAALDFYLAYGFEKTGRSEQDGQGRPYPLIHMQLAK